MADPPTPSPPTPRRTLVEIVAGALELPIESRAAYLAQACAGDAALEAEARSLVEAAGSATGFLDQPTQKSRDTASDEKAGATIGRYRLLEQIGEGGFGAVFMAEQREPVHRRVALKIIKLGMDTRTVVARFEAERQALALMDHPNIAKVLDAGATDSGRPYFVMELVLGRPIVEYCDNRRLDTDQRLDLFAEVCNAVQHAHTKGIIHRDLKPGNVLVSEVDGRPTPKVIDFGIAKATSARLTDKTLFTEFRQMIGTPAYMSPEQADNSSADVDARSDIYSLGVLLYELLTGVTPFDPQVLRSAAWEEMQRIIREDEPSKPSTRLSGLSDTIGTIAASRHTEPARLAAMVRGDLDWIVMRCLEKDRNRRYTTAHALAEDIRRHLSGDAVEAAPPSTVYRLRKFGRRHRVVFTTLACIAAALFSGLIFMGYGLYRATVAERLASKRLEQAEAARAEAVAAREKADKFYRTANAVTEFFTQDLLDLAPRPTGTPQVTVRELLDAVPAKIDKYFKSEPAVEGIIRERVGQLYRRLGELKRSSEYLVQAIPLLEAGLGPDSKQTLSAVQRLGELNMDLHRFEQAETLFDKAYRGRLKAYGMEYVMTGNSLLRRGAARSAAGRTEEGLADVRAIMEHTEKKEGRESRNYVRQSGEMADQLARAGKFEESLVVATEALAIIGRHHDTLGGIEWPARFDMTRALLKLNRNAEALVHAEAGFKILAEVYPAHHPTLVNGLTWRGQALAAVGRYPEAAADLEAAFELANAVYGPGNSDAHDAADLRAGVADKMGDVEAAKLWRSRMK